MRAIWALGSMAGQSGGRAYGGRGSLGTLARLWLILPTPVFGALHANGD